MADVTVNTESKNPRELLGQGIKAYVLQDYSAAVQTLSKASELLVEEHGNDLHDSLGEVYLYYGKALLALSREESEALGDAVPKNADEDEEEEEDDNDEADQNEENEEKASETEEKAKVEENGEKTESEKAVTNGEAEKPEAESKENDTEPAGSGEANGAEPSGSGEGEQSVAEEDDEPTDLQVAWEVLELAKKIYEKQGEKGHKNLSETMIVLGEISMESENFESAINDVKEGLEIQKKIYGTDNRTIAETLYKLGVAYSTNSQIEDAIRSFNESLECLKNRINSLEKNEDKKDAVDEEIAEIKCLIPDIEEKIADMKNYKEEAIKNLASAICEAKPSEASSSKAASDISHLVKRKRKVEEILEEKEQETTESPAKKPSP